MHFPTVPGRIRFGERLDYRVSPSILQLQQNKARRPVTEESASSLLSQLCPHRCSLLSPAEAQRKTPNQIKSPQGIVPGAHELSGNCMSTSEAMRVNGMILSIWSRP